MAAVARVKFFAQPIVIPPLPECASPPADSMPRPLMLLAEKSRIDSTESCSTVATRRVCAVAALTCRTELARTSWSSSTIGGGRALAEVD